jgi:hypothetical protein
VGLKIILTKAQFDKVIMATARTTLNMGELPPGPIPMEYLYLLEKSGACILEHTAPEPETVTHQEQDAD